MVQYRNRPVIFRRRLIQIYIAFRISDMPVTILQIEDILIQVFCQGIVERLYQPSVFFPGSFFSEKNADGIVITAE